jgi:hypothetical protein
VKCVKECKEREREASVHPWFICTKLCRFYCHKKYNNNFSTPNLHRPDPTFFHPRPLYCSYYSSLRAIEMQNRVWFVCALRCQTHERQQCRGDAEQRVRSCAREKNLSPAATHNGCETKANELKNIKHNDIQFFIFFGGH